MTNEQEPETPTTRRTLAHGAYTVGLVCALKTEYVAACEVLDEEHDMPQHSFFNDDNTYTLGRIGRHNVVIAVMPNGEYGSESAASTARDMVRSFINIRIGLMVGVGGGVPSTKHDIRLGDVVVSSPEMGRGGVYQYDFGKEMQGKPFQRNGFLNQSPRLLRAATATLCGRYDRKGNGIHETVKKILDKNRRLRRKYSRPSPDTEKLYKASYRHRPDHHTACNVECGDDPENLVEREPRDEDEDIVSVHYGLIASSNRVIRNADFRDRLAEQEGVLCFEMQAAGLMNHFPCLVIRGICNYSDSHKNDAWQGYAAMTAAAYAKDLLAQIAPATVESRRTVSEVTGSRQSVIRVAEDSHKTLRDFAKTLISQKGRLLNNREDTKTQGGLFGTALQAASAEGQQQVVQQLLAAGADVNAQGGHYGTALQAASARGQEQVIEKLLAAGADVDARGGAWGTALQAASYQGHQQVVEQLLAAGVDIDTGALQAASAGGQQQIVERLLAAGADIDARGGHYSTVIQTASKRGHNHEVVERLLTAGAE